MAKDAFLFTGRIAENYDKYLGPILFEPYGAEMAARISVPPTVASILEVACGTGRVTRHLRQRFQPPIKLTATDLSADMLHVAESKLGGLEIQFQVEDAQNLSFADDSFDLAVCQFGLMFLPDKKKGLSEIRRVLKPGGRFMFSTWDSTENVPLLKTLYHGNILPGFMPEDAQRLLVPFALNDAALLAGWMEDAGFKNIETARVVLQSGEATPEDIATAFFRKHSIGQEVLAADPAAFEAIAQKIQNDIAGQFPHHTTFQLSALFITGEK